MPVDQISRSQRHWTRTAYQTGCPKKCVHMVPMHLPACHVRSRGKEPLRVIRDGFAKLLAKPGHKEPNRCSCTQVKRPVGPYLFLSQLLRGLAAARTRNCEAADNAVTEKHSGFQ